MKKKVLALALVVATAASLCACGKTSATPTTPTTTTANTDPTTVANGEQETSAVDVVAPESLDLSGLSYQDKSSKLYDAILGNFYSAYEKANNAASVSERFALQAIAEAKLMESAVMLPTSTQGGMYAISRIAPHTNSTVLWGNDYERYYQRVVATEYIKATDRAEMNTKWEELKSTGTYITWAKQFLTDKGYTLKDEFSMGYTSDPQNWDVLATSRAADSEAIINTYDGLMEYNVENVLSPALATGYTVSEDGLTYTFTIRQGVKWVDSQGREVADVKADDFVAGMQHMMDVQGGLEYLIDGIIVKAHEYMAGDVTDFAEVGVKATDDYTLVYTLEAPCSYFITMLGYGVFAPMNRSYYISKGGAFGADLDTTADSYTYGKTKDDIAYCGPYLVTNATEKNTIVFKANDKYWNKDAVNVKTLTWKFNDGTDITKAYNDLKSSVLDGANLNSSTIPMAKNDNLFDTYSYVTDTNATSYMAFYTIDREAYANVNSATAAVSTQTDADKERTMKALRNVHFRRAISFAVDRAAYNAQATGEDLKLTSLRNCYTPGNFVSLAEEVTVDINGTAKKYPAGTYYGQIMQDQIDADGVSIKVWNGTSSDGYDGWYNVNNAVAELNAAIADLAKVGVTVDEANPILLDLPYPSGDEMYTNRAQAYKQSLEKALGNKVILNLVACADRKEWYYAGYYTETGSEANYNIYDLSGWGPDYGDPSTYLDTFLPDGAGYMIKCIGIF